MGAGCCLGGKHVLASQTMVRSQIPHGRAVCPTIHNFNGRCPDHENMVQLTPGIGNRVPSKQVIAFATVECASNRHVPLQRQTICSPFAVVSVPRAKGPTQHPPPWSKHTWALKSPTPSTPFAKLPSRWEPHWSGEHRKHRFPPLVSHDEVHRPA